MASLHECIDFGGILSGCRVTDSHWYWGLFNAGLFIEFRYCTFRESAFADCLFVRCRVEDCKFLQDKLDGGCSFEGCS